MLRERNYTCEQCGFSIKDQIDEINRIEFEKTYNMPIEKFHEWKSLILSQLQVHHIKPLVDNGKNSKSNLILLCEKCHKELEEDINSKKLLKNNTSISRVIIKSENKSSL